MVVDVRGDRLRAQPWPCGAGCLVGGVRRAGIPGSPLSVRRPLAHDPAAGREARAAVNEPAPSERCSSTSTPEWPSLITYSHHRGLDPTKVVPNPMQTATRYLVPDDRDFFAVYRRLPGPVSVPFK